MLHNIQKQQKQQKNNRDLATETKKLQKACKKMFSSISFTENCISCLLFFHQNNKNNKKTTENAANDIFVSL